tara:strand:+ start:2555 stop:3166 length:612 start_codon:yes stop_codon:yes gene_type:complete
MSIEIKISKRRISYKIAMNFMNKRVQKIKENKGKELLWILEHPLTYTAGIRFNQNEILDKKIKIINTNRGGKITLHNPGQKIVYFVVDLNKRKKDVRKFINIIEKSIIEFLAIYKINAKRDKKNIGIWVNEKKIAAIGLRISKWVVFHGFSINVNNNLNHYQKIVPCGLDNKKITSVNNESKIKIENLENQLSSILIKNIEKF